MGVANTSPPHFHLSHPSMYLPALAHWGGPLAAQQRHVTLEGQDFAILPPPHHTMHTSSAELRQLFDPSSSTSQFLVCPLPERKDGACVSWGGRCYISDLPLHEIGFGDIRIECSVALPLPPPIAKLAIMPSVSNHFSIKIQTASSLSSLSSFSLHPPTSLTVWLSPFSQLLHRQGRGDAYSLMIWSCRCPSNSHQRGQRQLTVVRRGTARTDTDSIRLPVHSKRTPELPHKLFNTQTSEQTRIGLRWTRRNTAVTFWGILLQFRGK